MRFSNFVNEEADKAKENLKDVIRKNKEIISLLKKIEGHFKTMAGEWIDLPGYSAHVVAGVIEARKVAEEYQKKEFEYSLRTWDE